MTTLPAAVWFDFSGTLFHIESARAALSAALGEAHADRADSLVRLGAINGSAMPDDLPPHLVDVWERRDLSAEAHRAAYSGSALHAGLTVEQADALYARGVSPQAWSPYPDTVEVLRRLREAGVRVAVISNIGWDPRPVFAEAGVEDLFDVLVLSYERGVQKPDQGIFELAADELGVPARRSLMIGDNAVNDGAASALGAGFALVPEDPARRDPDTLLRAVSVDWALSR